MKKELPHLIPADSRFPIFSCKISRCHHLSKMAKKAKSAKGLRASLRRYEDEQRSLQKKQHKLDARKNFELLKKKSLTGGNQTQHTKPGIVPFKPENTILLVGEGDFSFAVSIVKQELALPTNVIATSYDSKEEVCEKYVSAAENLQFLESHEVCILFNIDATNLQQTLGLKLKKKPSTLFSSGQKLDVVLFNFPHTGKGIKDMDRNVREHQKLILHYFKSCDELFNAVNSRSMDAALSGYSKSNDERIVLSVFEGEPYISWGIKALSRSEGWKVERSGRFDWKLFPDYHHRRTNSMKDTTKEASIRDARTYIFERKNEESNNTE